MNNLSFSRSDVVNRTNIVVHSHDLKEIDITKPLMVTSGITKKTVAFEYDDYTTRYENEMNEGWDGEEWHLFFKDTEGKGITLNVWDSPNFH